MPDLDTDDLAALIKACDIDLGEPNLWFTPDGYPDSLVLCIVDSIYSTGARYSSVVNVVERYREYRTNQIGTTLFPISAVMVNSLRRTPRPPGSPVLGSAPA